jgi:hypothetical protein
VENFGANVTDFSTRGGGSACQRFAKEHPSSPPLVPLVPRHLCSGALLGFPIDLVPNASESNSKKVGFREGLLGVSEEEDQVCGGTGGRNLCVLPEGR